MKFLPIVVTAVSAFHLPYQGANTVVKPSSSLSKPSCTGRFLYIDTDNDPSNGNQPRVLVTPPTDVNRESCRRNEELTHRSLLAERLRLEQKTKNEVSPTTTSETSILELSNDDQSPPRVIITPPVAETSDLAPPAALSRDEEHIHRALLAERLRMNKKKISETAETELVGYTTTATKTDDPLNAKMKKERFQRALLTERLQMENKFRPFETLASVDQAVVMEEVPIIVEEPVEVDAASEANDFPSWQQELIQKSAEAVNSRRQQKQEHAQRALLEERLRMETKIRHFSGTVVDDLVDGDEKVEQVVDTVWKVYAPESDGLDENEHGTTWSTDEILAADFDAEAEKTVVEQPNAITDEKEAFQRSLLKARLKMGSKLKNASNSKQSSPVTIATPATADVEEVKEVTAVPTVSVEAIVSPKLAKTTESAQPRISVAENKKISEIAKYIKTVSVNDIASGVVDAFKPEKGVMQLLKEEVDDIKLLGYAASQLTGAVVDGTIAVFLTLRAFVGNAPSSSSSDQKESDSNVISSSVEKEMEKIVDIASESTKHAVSGCVALAALTFKQLTRARDYVEEQKIEIELANQRRLAEQKEAEILRARIEEEKRIERELDNERQLAEQKAIEIIKARAEEAKRKLEREAMVAEEKVVNQIRMDVESKKKSLLGNAKVDKKDETETMQSDDAPYFARKI